MDNAHEYVQDPIKNQGLLSGIMDMIDVGIKVVRFKDGTSVFKDLLTGQTGFLRKGEHLQEQVKRFKNHY